MGSKSTLGTTKSVTFYILMRLPVPLVLRRPAESSHLIRSTFIADLVNRFHCDSSSSRLVYKNETHLIVKSA